MKLAHTVSRKTQERILREAKIQLRLDHPNILPVVDVLDLGPRGLGVVMDLITGPDLASLLSRGALPADLGLKLFRDIVDAIIAAHERQVIHRDLKPSNVLVEGWPDRARAVVADFGLGKAAWDDLTITTSSGLLGTAPYVAPEQVQQPAKVSGRADIFSLGCILYELFAGRRAFPGDDLMDILERAASGAWERLDAPPGVCAALEGCLAPDPSRRIPNGHVLLDVLAGQRVWTPRGERPTSGASSDERSTPRWPGRGRPLMAATGAALALVGLFVATRTALEPPLAARDAPLRSLAYRPQQLAWAVSPETGLVYFLPTEQEAVGCAASILPLAARTLEKTRRASGSLPVDQEWAKELFTLNLCAQVLTVRFPAIGEGDALSAVITAGCARGRRFAATLDGRVSELARLEGDEIAAWFRESGVIRGQGLGPDDVWSHARGRPACGETDEPPMAAVSPEVSCALEALHIARSAELLAVFDDGHFSRTLDDTRYELPAGCEGAAQVQIATVAESEALLEAIVCEGEDEGTRFFLATDHSMPLMSPVRGTCRD